jgi:cadmium resistance protein CadD (predicted permease)
MQQCAFCSQAIDPLAAEESAAATSKISQSCSDASYLRIMAWALVTFFVILFVPFFSLLGLVGLWFLRLAIPVMVIRWWIKFGAIKTADPDFSRAKRSVILVSIVAVLGLASALRR